MFAGYVVYPLLTLSFLYPLTYHPWNAWIITPLLMNYEKSFQSQIDDPAGQYNTYRWLGSPASRESPKYRKHLGKGIDLERLKTTPCVRLGIGVNNLNDCLLVEGLVVKCRTDEWWIIDTNDLRTWLLAREYVSSYLLLSKERKV